MRRVVSNELVVLLSIDSVALLSIVWYLSGQLEMVSALKNSPVWAICGSGCWKWRLVVASNSLASLRCVVNLLMESEARSSFRAIRLGGSLLGTMLVAAQRGSARVAAVELLSGGGVVVVMVWVGISVVELIDVAMVRCGVSTASVVMGVGLLAVSVDGIHLD